MFQSPHRALEFRTHGRARWPGRKGRARSVKGTTKGLHGGHGQRRINAEPRRISTRCTFEAVHWQICCRVRYLWRGTRSRRRLASEAERPL